MPYRMRSTAATRCSRSYHAIDDFERGFDIESLPDAALCDLCDENLVRYVIATMAEYLYGSGSGRRIINRRGDEAYRIAAGNGRFDREDTAHTLWRNRIKSRIIWIIAKKLYLSLKNCN